MSPMCDTGRTRTQRRIEASASRQRGDISACRRQLTERLTSRAPGAFANIGVISTTAVCVAPSASVCISPKPNSRIQFIHSAPVYSNLSAVSISMLRLASRLWAGDRRARFAWRDWRAVHRRILSRPSRSKATSICFVAASIRSGRPSWAAAISFKPALCHCLHRCFSAGTCSTIIARASASVMSCSGKDVTLIRRASSAPQPALPPFVRRCRAIALRIRDGGPRFDRYLACVQIRGPRERLILARVAQHIAAPPHRLEIILTLGGVGEFLAQLADEHVNDLLLGLVHAAIEVVEKGFFGQGGALAQAQELQHLILLAGQVNLGPVDLHCSGIQIDDEIIGLDHALGMAFGAAHDGMDTRHQLVLVE